MWYVLFSNNLWLLLDSGLSILSVEHLKTSLRLQKFKWHKPQAEDWGMWIYSRFCHHQWRRTWASQVGIMLVAPSIVGEGVAQAIDWNGGHRNLSWRHGFSSGLKLSVGIQWTFSGHSVDIQWTFSGHSVGEWAKRTHISAVVFLLKHLPVAAAHFRVRGLNVCTHTWLFFPDHLSVFLFFLFLGDTYFF